MYFLPREAVGAMPWLLIVMSRFTNAYCECGYSINKTTDPSYQVYTEIFENDFLHATNITAQGWKPQEYNVSAHDARGPYGKDFLVENIVTNPLKNKYDWAGASQAGGDAGLQLWVRGSHNNGFVSGAEMTTAREDQMFGSYRIGMKLGGAGTGTCGAFFWFFNNSQEIDMEFLNKEFNSSAGVVNLVLQTPQSVEAGYDAANTSDYRIQSLPYNPDQEFHEYRFDWQPGKVSFYVDGSWLWDMTKYVPTGPGHLFVNHWSNGDPLWSGGPPAQDTALTISYIKAYFNSSDSERQDDYSTRCPTSNLTKVCEIPAQTVAPDPSGANPNSTARTYFFFLDPGHAPNQTVYNTTNSTKHSGAEGGFAPSSLFAYLPLFVALFSWAVAL